MGGEEGLGEGGEGTGDGGEGGGGEGAGRHEGHTQDGECSLMEGRLEQEGWVHFLQELQKMDPSDLRMGLLQTEQGKILRLGGPGLGWMSPQLRRKEGM